jgi:hypothetical protein
MPFDKKSTGWHYNKNGKNRIPTGEQTVKSFSQNPPPTRTPEGIPLGAGGKPDYDAWNAEIEKEGGYLNWKAWISNLFKLW